MPFYKTWRKELDNFMANFHAEKSTIDKEIETPERDWRYQIDFDGEMYRILKREAAIQGTDSYWSSHSPWIYVNRFSTYNQAVLALKKIIAFKTVYANKNTEINIE